MSIDLYNDVFGFSERPFTLLPDPSFLFWSPAHSRAFAILEYGLMTRAPLTVVTGEVGTGKTTLVQALLYTLEDDVVVGLISNAQGGRGDLMRWVLNALDVRVNPGADYVALFQEFQDFLIEEYSQGRRIVLVIDEAQNLPVELLEELRMLTNINAGKDELLQLVLVGQPELRDMISRPELRQFAQRVSATYHIDPMDQRTTRDYIHHRLTYVGGTGSEFSPQAIKMIFEQSDGIPRIVNKLCDLGLVYAASAGRKQVGLTTIKELLRDGLLIKTHRPTQEDSLKNAAQSADRPPPPDDPPRTMAREAPPAEPAVQVAHPQVPRPQNPHPQSPGPQKVKPLHDTDLHDTGPHKPRVSNVEPLYLTNRIDKHGNAAE
ncbi:MAG: AAA family ATPase [Pseudomonadota bacterium]